MYKFTQSNVYVLGEQLYLGRTNYTINYRNLLELQFSSNNPFCLEVQMDKKGSLATDLFSDIEIFLKITSWTHIQVYLKGVNMNSKSCAIQCSEW